MTVQQPTPVGRVTVEGKVVTITGAAVVSTGPVVDSSVAAVVATVTSWVVMAAVVATVLSKEGDELVTTGFVVTSV